MRNLSMLWQWGWSMLLSRSRASANEKPILRAHEKKKKWFFETMSIFYLHEVRSFVPEALFCILFCVQCSQEGWKKKISPRNPAALSILLTMRLAWNTIMGKCLFSRRLHHCVTNITFFWLDGSVKDTRIKKIDDMRLPKVKGK